MTGRSPQQPRDEGASPARFRQVAVLSGVGATSGSSLHRGTLLDGTPVLVKRVEGVADPRAASDQLRRERELLDMLAQADAGPRPLALLPHPASPALLLEDRPGELLDRLLARRRLELAECLAVGVDLAAALAELHAARLVYRDLRPANVLVGRAEGEPRLRACLVDLSRTLREGSPLLAAAGDDLAYLAPERTGRIGREVDGRSDLYSLGVLLYLLLTGSPPFTASDLLGWVHCHVARQPRPPADAGPVPRSVSDLVMKLLAKLPDDRYQSALGVKADLAECLNQCRAGIDRPFTLGLRDSSGRFQLPSRFYGREPELDVLLRAHHRSAVSGETALVLIRGPSGIGKTSLVDELRRRLSEDRVHYGAGKFDRDRRALPHGTLGAALGGLVQQILSASEKEVARWRGVLLDALGSQGRLISEVVPQLGLLIGPQPPVPELPPQEAQKRFERVWQRFLAALAGPEHPLVLFLDDLQWADAETLSLLEYAVGDPGTRHLLLVGAYRDSEVDPSHSVARTVEALRAGGVAVETIVPGPFSLEDVTRLVTDAVPADRTRCLPLARLIHVQTGGNPLLALHLLSTLVEEGLISFQRASGEWTWDLARIQARQAGDDPSALMAERLRQLPEPTRRVLRIAGSLGNGTKLDTLALMDGRPREETDRDLAGAVDRGLLVLRADDTYAFSHDRVAEAAKDLTPEAERPRVHHHIARVLLERWSGQPLGDRVFDLVSHLLRAGPRLGQDERLRLAELELEAGRRAQAAMAHPSAARHFAEGQTFLPSDAWRSCYPLSYALALERARSEWLAGDHAAAEEWIAVLLREARSRAERADAYRVRLDLLTTRNDVMGCVHTALEACATLYGLEFPLHPTPEILGRAMFAALEALQGRTIEEQVEAPEMDDVDQRALVALCSSAAPTAFFVDPMLHNLMLCEVVRLSFQYGNSPHSSHALASFALSVGVFLGRWSDAFRFSSAACALAERNRTHSVGCWFLAGILERQAHPPADAIAPFLNGWRAAVDGGDVNHGCQAGFVLFQTRLAAGEPLADVAEEGARQLEFARSARYVPIQDTVLAQLRFVESLRGGTLRLGSLEGPGFDAAAFEARLAPHFPFLPEAYFGYRAFAELLAGDFAAALASSAQARPFAQEGPIGTNEHYRFVTGLAAAARCDEVAAEERAPLLALAVECRDRLQGSAARNPRTFTASLTLLSAELARLEGRELDAARAYDEAMTAARQEGFVHVEAMAGETAARYHRRRGSSLGATAYLRAAADAYRRWGATAKVAALVAEHPEIQSERAEAPGAIAGVAQLDLLAATRASQAISGEMNLERLLEVLLRTVVEAAGAQSGSLLLDGGAELALTAQATVNGAEIDVRVSTGSPAVSGDLPASILSYARRTLQPVVLWDTAAPNPYSGDPALRRRGARSVVCLPILRRGALKGLLYLENDLVPSAFTPERLALLELLAAQAAISLELSRHREQLEQLVTRRTAELTSANESLKAANRKLELAHRQLLHSEKMASIGRLAAGVAHEINNPVAYVASNLHAMEDNLRELLEAAGAARSDAPERLRALRNELASLIGDTRYGLDRVTTIVRALRIFSHANESAWQVTDVRPGLDSTLHLLRNDVEHKAVVVVEHGELPPIECVPPELGQVFMNVVLNAVQAIPERGTITVRSGVAGEDVWIEVSDTGVGIPPENLSRIFDPFFTTKPVGEGTGLGLALAYGVVEKHHGRIDVSSEPGKGTTFRIWLPVRQPALARA